MNINKIKEILEYLMAQSLGIQKIALVSSEGYPIIVPIGIDESSVMVLAGSFLRIAQLSSQNFHDSTFDKITLRAKEGQISLIPCQEQMFLLVIASLELSSLVLENRIDLALKKLRGELEDNSSSEEKLPKLDSNVSSSKGRNNSYSIKNNPIRYRGLPIVE